MKVQPQMKGSPVIYKRGDLIRRGEFFGLITNVRIGTPRSRDNYRIKWVNRPRVAVTWIWASEVDGLAHPAMPEAL